MSDRWNKYLELLQERPELFSESELIPIVTDYEIVNKYEKETGKEIGVLYTSAYNMLVVDLIRGENENYYTYERLVPAVQRGAVVIMATCKERAIVLCQYRHSTREFQYGFPRGFGEMGISPEDNVKKEIKEEINAEVLSCKYLGDLTPDSGVTANKVSYFWCEVDSYEEKLGYEGINSVVALELEELEEWIQNGTITDGYTVAAYSLYRMMKKHED